MEDQTADTLGRVASPVNGETRIFWWQTELERHQDRIYICPLKIRDGGRILVGIFCHHLTT
jgi:hypothetical protein